MQTRICKNIYFVNEILKNIIFDDKNIKNESINIH